MRGISPILALVAGVCGCTLDWNHVRPPVGSSCSAGNECSGRAATCLTTGVKMYSWPTPQGYCSNSGCASDADCGNTGFCDTDSGLCFGKCDGANKCQEYNPDNRCFYWADHGACLSQGVSRCDPTSPDACDGTGACRRAGYENIGFCYDICAFNQACTPSNGSSRACYQMNQTMKKQTDGSVIPTGDVYDGWACLVAGATGEGAKCVFFNDCTSGLQCDFYLAGGSQVCRRQCRAGFRDCGSGETCVDAFRLGADFRASAGGLCL